MVVYKSFSAQINIYVSYYFCIYPASLKLKTSLLPFFLESLNYQVFDFLCPRNHGMCTTHSFLNAFILTFLVCVNACGGVQAVVGQVSAETTVGVFRSFSCILLCPDLNTTHMNPKGLLLEQLHAGTVQRRVLWSFPAACPLWLVGQNSSQQESQNCSKLFPGC